jgi:hypothetical protein
MHRKLAPALIAPLLVVTACATAADEGAVEVRTGPETVLALRAAPDAVADAGTAAFEMVMEISAQGESFTIDASGAYDAANQRMSMEIDMGAMFEGLAASSGEEVPPGFGEPMRMVVDGTTIYMQAPMLAFLGDGAGWVSYTPEDLGMSSQALGLGASAYDPSSYLESLRGATGEPEVVGTEEVRGVETTHYVATMDLAAALASVPEQQRDLAEAQLGQLGGGTIPLDVWIDADGLPRRLVMDMSELFSSMGMGQDAGAVTTVEYFDYGVPVDIEVPSPDEVTSFADELGGLGGFEDEAS